MPSPTAPNAPATASAASTLPHWPTAAVTSNGNIGQNQGELAAAARVRHSRVTCTFRRSIETMGPCLRIVTTLSCAYRSSVSTCWPNGLKLRSPYVGRVVAWRQSVTASTELVLR